MYSKHGQQPTWTVHACCCQGGVLEAFCEDVTGSPSAHLFIEPGTGAVKVLATTDRLAAPESLLSLCCGRMFPCASVAPAALHAAAMAVGERRRCFADCLRTEQIVEQGCSAELPLHCEMATVVSTLAVVHWQLSDDHIFKPCQPILIDAISITSWC